MKKENRFNIDFFEFSFLVTACLPKSPIARTMFFHRVIDKYYYVLTQDERNRLYEWVMREYQFEEGLKKGEKDCVWFEKRYNPDNQYKVTTDFKGKIEEIEAFKGDDGRYYKARNTWVSEEYITKIEKF